jgi:hypothetical protein
MRKLLTPCATLFPLLLLTGCAITGHATDGSCKIFKPITNSTKDTTPTRREVIAHNKVFGAICK